MGGGKGLGSREPLTEGAAGRSHNPPGHAYSDASSGQAETPKRKLA